jgi:hypothetical protein
MTGMAVRRGHSNGGRRSKGERRLVVTRVAPEIADRVAAAAEERGMTVSDYLATLVYSDLDIPLPPPVQPTGQMQLPISA